MTATPERLAVSKETRAFIRRLGLIECAECGLAAAAPDPITFEAIHSVAIEKPEIMRHVCACKR